MQKLLVILLLSMMAFGAELHYAHDYKSAVSQAKKENKNIFLLITTPTCKWCKKLKATTLKDATVVARINAGFIPVQVFRDKDDYPSHLKAQMVPKSYFLYPDGSTIMRGTMGYWNVEDYLSIMDDVDYKIKKHARIAAEK